ncbi:MAG: PKD domain-containing protein [Candidatus Lokiarchaeota archaeon]|nr:PKD domain-containing protein [Candidatus Lokiarchaeota archaeon]
MIKNKIRTLIIAFLSFCVIFLSIGSNVRATSSVETHYYGDTTPDNYRGVFNNSATDFQNLVVGFGDLGDDMLLTGIGYYYNTTKGTGTYSMGMVLTQGAGLPNVIYADYDIPAQLSPGKRYYRASGGPYLIDNNPSVLLLSYNDSVDCISICVDTSITNFHSAYDVGPVPYDTWIAEVGEYMIDLFYEPIEDLSENTVLTGSFTSTDYVDAYYVNLTAGTEYEFCLDTNSGNANMRLCNNDSVVGSVSLASNIGTSTDPEYMTYTPSTTDTYVLLVEPGTAGIDITDYYIELYCANPTASFSANATDIVESQWVQFTYNGSGGNRPLTYLWDFGDSFTATGPAVTHQYMIGGTYDVNLTVIDNSGDNDTSIQSINVANSIPTASFSANVTTIVESQWIQFTYTGTGGTIPITCLWDFGDGTNTTGPTVSHQYLTAGTYDVNLTVIDGNGDNDTVILSIEVQEDLEPIADFEADRLVIEVSESITFSFIGSEGNGIASYLWTFGDGETSTDANPTHTYTTVGNYTVTLSIVDSDGDQDTETKTDYIEVISTESETEDTVPGYDLFMVFGLISLVSFIALYSIIRKRHDINIL